MIGFISFVIWYFVGFISLCIASLFIDDKTNKDEFVSFMPILSVLGFLIMFCALLVGAYFALYKLSTISVAGTLALSKKVKLFVLEMREGGKE